jgi:amino acid adenylation domain-containing protein/thioester reductase-like protein
MKVSRLPGGILPGIGPRLAVPKESSVIALFEAAAERFRHRPAVRFRDTTLTYEQLNGRANGLAKTLAARGARVGEVVPLLVADGLEFPIGLLAAMKTGAPFVPIDPAWPRSRLSGLFDRLAPRTILTVTSNIAILNDLGFAGRALYIDRSEPGEYVSRGAGPGPDDLIYGYFTSGSTGIPKCALNKHRGLVNRLTAMSHHFGDGADHVVLQNSRPTFDSSMWQLLWPLTTGGLVVLPDRDGILDLERTCRILAGDRVTITDFVPSVLSALVGLLEARADLRHDLSGLRRMLIGGEEAGGVVLTRLRKLLPGLKVTNTYGPTECSIGSVFHDITDVSGRIPLGTPIPNTAAVILDDDRRPVPPGTVGEIYIGGLCVGAGYLGDEERTAEAFLPNPFPEIPSGVLYRTGDLGHHENGLLMFDGRRDDQVKVGGVRIELAEVERALLTHAAGVIVRGEGEARALAAFVALCPGALPADAPAELRDWLRASLPPETLPRSLQVVDDLPLTSHGKLDRRALERRRDAIPAQDASEPPATVHEELVASLWREVLGRGDLSVTVPFADYGGTSLQLHRLSVLMGLREARPVRLEDLFRAETVRAQAQLLTIGPPPDRPRFSTIALERDAEPSGLPGPGVPPPPFARRPLLTGATGFIGAHLLAELLTGSGAEISCLVRAADPGAGGARLAAALRYYELQDAATALPNALRSGRLRVVTGDLTAPSLGLGQARFRGLAGDIDAILHAGALVNFLTDYADHRAANVLGIRELIRLASGGAGARLHVLSTFSVFPAGQRAADGPIGGDRLPRLDSLPEGGYNQSKLVAEHLLARARALRVESVVYRLGEIWPHRRIGVPNPSSLAQSVVYAAARTGIVFPTAARTDHLPVDTLARYLAGTALGAGNPAGNVVHLLRPGGLSFVDVFDRLDAESLGYAHFRRRLDALAESAEADSRLVRVAMLLPPPDGSSPVAPLAFDRLFTDSSRHFAGTAGTPVDGSPSADLTAFIHRLGA